MGVIKYTKESLKFIKDCSSIREALILLGLKPDGGNKRLRILIKEVLIENNTFKGQSHSKGKKYFKKSNEEFFIKDLLKRSSFSVRNALFDRGLKERRCECCNETKWMGSNIPLEVHHIDGDNTNNKLDNLQILCPNCHYFTDNYKSKNIKNKLLFSSDGQSV